MPGWTGTEIKNLCADVIERLFSIITERSWHLRDWKKANVTAVFKTDKKDLENKRLVSFIWLPGK